MARITIPIVFIDSESTGTNVVNDRICDIALIKFQGGEIIDEFQSYVNPGIQVPQEATNVHGLTNEFLSDKPTFRMIAQQVNDFISGCDLAGHNIMGFDVPLLNEELLREGFKIGMNVKCIDTMQNQAVIAPRTLAGCYEYYEGQKPGNDLALHSALIDAKISAHIFAHQIRKHENLLGDSRESLHAIATRGKRIIDFSGKLKLNDEGFICYAFGKNENRRVSSDSKYAEWMLSTEFTRDTKEWIKYALKFNDKFIPS